MLSATGACIGKYLKRLQIILRFFKPLLVLIMNLKPVLHMLFAMKAEAPLVEVECEWEIIKCGLLCWVVASHVT